MDVYSSDRTKSSRMRLARGVSHCKRSPEVELAASSMRRETAAAVKDFVVLAV